MGPPRGKKLRLEITKILRIPKVFLEYGLPFFLLVRRAKTHLS